MTAPRRHARPFRIPCIKSALGALAIGAMLAGTTAAQDKPADLTEGIEAVRAGNFKKALAEWLPLARDGNADAAYGIGDIYRNGKGVKRDPAEAARWYRVAAERSHPVAQYNLAVLQTLGDGVPTDLVEARHWYKLAAEQDFAPAQYNLAVLYAAGKGGPADFVQAWMWFDLAAAHGHDEAARTRDLLAAEMTGKQVDAAKELAGEWRAQHEKGKQKKQKAG